MSTVVTGREIIGAKLAEAGLIPDNTKRLIIDVPCDGVVKVYYDTFGNEHLCEAVVEALLKNKTEITIIPIE